MREIKRLGRFHLEPIIGGNMGMEDRPINVGHFNGKAGTSRLRLFISPEKGVRKRQAAAIVVVANKLLGKNEGCLKVDRYYLGRSDITRVFFDFIVSGEINDPVACFDRITRLLRRATEKYYQSAA